MLFRSSEMTAPYVDFVKAADQLEENEVTDAIDSDGGLYVGKVTSLFDREATDKEKERIVRERKDDQYDSLLKKWKEDTKITLNEEVWQKIDFAYQGIAIPKNEDDGAKDDKNTSDEKEDDADSDKEDAQSEEEDEDSEN